MIHLGRNTFADISKGSAQPAQNTYRGLVSVHQRANARITRSATRFSSQGVRGAYVPTLKAAIFGGIEHEATTSKIATTVVYCTSRGLAGRSSALISTVLREVLQPIAMEFAVEAQKLVGISLEGSVDEHARNS